MDVGDRVATPAGMWPEEYVEMRCCGLYERNVVSAVVFQLVEIATLNSDQGKAANRSLLRLFPQEGACVTEVVSLGKSLKANLPAVLETVNRLAITLVEEFKTRPNDSTSFERLCQAGDFSLTSLYFGGQMNSKANTAEVYMGQKSGTMFLLYTAYTLDSFIDLPCGHFDLKFTYFRKLREQVMDRAISESDLKNIELRSNCCGKDVKEGVFHSCFPEAETPSPQRARKGQCQKCQKKIKSICPLSCNCGDLCLSCSSKGYLTADYSVTVCCGTAISDIDIVYRREAVFESNQHLAQLLKGLKHDKKVAIMKNAQRKCSACNNQFIANSLRDELICAKCVTKREAVRQSQHGRSTSSIAQRQSKNDHETMTLVVPTFQGNRARSSMFGGQMAEEPGGNRRKIEESKKPPEKPLMPKLPPSIPRIPLSVSQPGTKNAPAPHFDLSQSANPKAKPSLKAKFNPVLPPCPSPPSPSDPDDIDEGPIVVIPNGGAAHDALRVPEPVRQKCRSCKDRLSAEDEHIGCQNQCQCASCCVEFILQTKKKHCMYCRVPFDYRIIEVIQKGMLRCHVCGIVVPAEQIEKNAPCTVCMWCVRLEKKVRRLWTDKIVGVCSQCGGEGFDVKESKYLKLATEEMTWACCEKGKLSKERLQCGHTVCKSHALVLKRCRKCGQRVPDT